MEDDKKSSVPESELARAETRTTTITQKSNGDYRVVDEEEDDEAEVMLRKLQALSEGRTDSSFEYYPSDMMVEYRPLQLKVEDSEEEEEEIDWNFEDFGEEKWPVTVDHSEMDSDMKEEAIRVASKVIETDLAPCAVSGAIKRHFEKTYGCTWHCIVGDDFSSFVSYEPRKYIYFRLRSTYILLFKTRI